MPITRLRFPAIAMTGNGLILSVAAFLLATANLSFFGRLLRAYPTDFSHLWPLLSLAATFGGITVLLLGLLCFGRSATKPALMLVLVLSALTAHFMDSYGVVINGDMLQNAVETNLDESLDLLTPSLLARLFFLGLLPAAWVWHTKLAWRGWRTELLARLKLIVISLIVIVGAALAFGSFYASFLREHKAVRTYANPAFPLYAAVRYAHTRLFAPTDRPIEAIGTDARIPSHDTSRELIVLIVGETARADHFSLNGYARDTNPLLRKEDVISLNNFYACGTSTAASLPCMFALPGSGEKVQYRENLLDTLAHAGVNVLWLDNNSDSKGVAVRVPYQSYKSPTVNPVCDIECRDEGMLASLQAYIDTHPTGDIFIVMHQMGNHGPAYHKRYPPAFERFTPVCRSNDLSRCTREEIVNAYDNALLYTDHFLARTIDLLKHNDTKFETALLYVSDHGESLGEAGIYLHGLPKTVAPKAQLHVPAILWFGKHFEELDSPALRKKTGQRFTHDHLFHTVLGLMEIETAIYRPELDILNGCRRPEPP